VIDYSDYKNDKLIILDFDIEILLKRAKEIATQKSAIGNIQR